MHLFQEGPAFLVRQFVEVVGIRGHLTVLPHDRLSEADDGVADQVEIDANGRFVAAFVDPLGNEGLGGRERAGGQFVARLDPGEKHEQRTIADGRPCLLDDANRQAHRPGHQLRQILLLQAVAPQALGQIGIGVFHVFGDEVLDALPLLGAEDQLAEHGALPHGVGVAGRVGQMRHAECAVGQGLHAGARRRGGVVGPCGGGDGDDGQAQGAAEGAAQRGGVVHGWLLVGS